MPSRRLVAVAEPEPGPVALAAELEGARLELIERMRAAADEGVPIARIAREAGVSRPTAYEWLKRS